MKLISIFFVLTLFGCKPQPKSGDTEILTESDKTPSSRLIDLLKGKWQLETNPDHTILITKDSLLDYYKSEVSRSSSMIIDSLSVADKYLVADTAYNFINDKEPQGLKIRLWESSKNDSSNILLIYIDRNSLELGTHNGSHFFKRME